MHYSQFKLYPEETGGTRKDFRQIKPLQLQKAQEKAAEISKAAEKFVPLLKKILATRIKYVNIGDVKEKTALAYQICDDAAIVLGFFLQKKGFEVQMLRGWVPY